MWLTIACPAKLKAVTELVNKLTQNLDNDSLSPKGLSMDASSSKSRGHIFLTAVQTEMRLWKS